MSIETDYSYGSSSHGLVDGVTYAANNGSEALPVGYFYTGRDQLDHVEDGNGHITTYAWDALDRMTKRTDPDPDGSTGTTYTSSVTKFQYDANSQLTHVTDPRGKVTETVYDQRNLVGQTIQPMADNTSWTSTKIYSDATTTGGTSWSSTYVGSSVAVGNYVKSTSGNGGTATYTFTSGLSSGAKYEVLVRWAPQSGTTYDKDAVWQVYGNTSASPLGTLRLDLNHAPQSLPDSNGFMWLSLGAFTPYTSGGTSSLTIKLTDDNNNGPLVIDSVRLVKTGPVTTYTHDTAGNVETLTDPDGNKTTFGYNGWNQVTSESNQLNDVRSYDYWPTGEPKEVEDRNGRVTQYQFDPENRTTTEQWMNGSTVTRSIVHSYDNLWRLTGVTDHDGSGTHLSADYAYSYDDTARTVTTTADIVGLSSQVVFTESLNGNGLRSQLTATLGTTADFKNTYDYDHLNRQKQVIQQSNGGNTVASKRADFTYTGTSQLNTIVRYANTTNSNYVATTKYTYDDADRLTGLSHKQGFTTTFANYALTYDDAGRITAITNSQQSGENVSYTYDNNWQLTGADFSTQNDESYAYDANGNLYSGSIWAYSPYGYTSTSDSLQVTTNNQLIGEIASEVDFASDDEGNRTSRIDHVNGYDVQYAWDYRNRLTQVDMYGSDDPDNPFSTSITEQTKYTYDAFNRLIARTNDYTNTREIFVYDGDQIVLRFSVSGTTSTASASNLKDRFVWAPGVDLLLADEKVTSLGSAGTVSWPLADHQNTIRDVAEYNSGTSTTSVANHNTYDAYGYKISQSDAAHDVIFAYTGRYLDVRDRFQFNGNRWYDTTTRRFLSEDPIGLAGGTNLQRYAGNSPTNFTDPTGLLPTDEDARADWIRAHPNPKGRIHPSNAPYRLITGRGQSYEPTFWSDFRTQYKEHPGYWVGVVMIGGAGIGLGGIALGSATWGSINIGSWVGRFHVAATIEGTTWGAVGSVGAMEVVEHTEYYWVPWVNIPFPFWNPEFMEEAKASGQLMYNCVTAVWHTIYGG